MLALQEEVGQASQTAGEVADRDARRHGRQILEALVALQRDLLHGVSLEASVSHLNALVARSSHPKDPALARALVAIHLRARVEMLRLHPKFVATPPGDTSAS